jgi:hypothetical protein
MLRHTQEQERAVIGMRSLANVRATRMMDDIPEPMRASGLVGNASPIPRDVWGEWDREAVQLQRDILSVHADLAASVSRGLPIGKVVSYAQAVSDSGDLAISLDGRVEAKTDQPVIRYDGTPVPIVNSTFSFGWRQMAAASSEGFDLDPAARANATRRVAEGIEDATLDGWPGIVVGDATSYGLRTHPDRATRTTGTAINGASGPDILAEIAATTALLYARNQYVEPTIYMNVADVKYMRETDVSPNYAGKTILQRALESGITGIVPASRVRPNEIIAVVKRRETVRVLNAMPISTIPLFRANPHDDYAFMTMAATSVQIVSDYAGSTGIAHSAPA